MFEKIKERNMTKFVLSSLINTGIGLAFGLVVAIIVIIADGGYHVGESILAAFGWALVFGIFTSNLYRMYFYYQLSLDINAICEGDGEESESYLLALTLSFLTLGFYRLYWTYKLAKRLRANAPRYGYKMLETGKDIVILNAFSFGFIGAWELIKYMNRISTVYNVNGLAETQEV